MRQLELVASIDSRGFHEDHCIILFIIWRRAEGFAQDPVT